MQDQIPEFLLEKFTATRPHVPKFPNEHISFMLEYSKFYEWNITDIKLVFKMMKKGYSIKPVCEYNDCTNTKAINIKKGEFSIGCCVDHSQKISNLCNYGVTNPSKLLSVQKKRDATNLKRYGSINVMGNKEVQQKFNQSIKIKYGVDNYFQSIDFKNKNKETLMEKYGVDNSMKDSKVKQKAKQTLFDNYGVYSPMQSTDILTKWKQQNQQKYGTDYFVQTDKFKEMYIKSSLKNFGVENPMKNKSFIIRLVENHKLKYGVENPMQRESIKLKLKDTMLNRYGVPHLSQVPEFLAKIQYSAYKMKEYLWKTGEVSMVQGYEPIVLKELEDKGYSYSEILTDILDMPKIMYYFKGKQHRYYPDMFIPSENKIIEVKSDYTLEKEWDKNQAKFEATRALGFDFRLEVR